MKYKQKKARETFNYVSFIKHSRFLINYLVLYNLQRFQIFKNEFFCKKKNDNSNYIRAKLRCFCELLYCTSIEVAVSALFKKNNKIPIFCTIL